MVQTVPPTEPKVKTNKTLQNLDSNVDQVSHDRVEAKKDELANKFGYFVGSRGHGRGFAGAFGGGGFGGGFGGGGGGGYGYAFGGGKRRNSHLARKINLMNVYDANC